MKRTYALSEPCYSWTRNVTTETVLNNSYNRISCNRLRKVECNLMSAESVKTWRR